MDTIKAGVIGAGFVGPLHVEALRRLGGVEVLGLADEDEDLARRKAEALWIPRHYGNWRDLVNDPDIQVVHVCTPNYLHFEINQAVIEAGKPIVSEKPLATTSEGSRELLHRIEKAEIPNEVCFTYRMYPVIQQMQAMVGRGEIGQPWIVWGAYLQDWLFAQTDYNWRMDPETSGPSRATADIGSHWCEIAQFVTGQRIASVSAQFGVVHPTRMKPRLTLEAFANVGQDIAECDEVPITTEDYAAVLVKFSGGAIGTFSVSQVSAGRKNHILLEVNGSRCSLAWNHEDAERLWIGNRDGPSHSILRDPALFHPSAREFCHYPAGHPEGYVSGFRNLFQAFYACLRSGRRWGQDKPNFPTFWEGHRSMLILDAIIRSARENRWVEVDYSSLPPA
ncbi:MAG: Gfo/Idh/MocA family oxidoreductase [Anaerolineales bacterium]|jgi:predicted dehydrogenase